MATLNRVIDSISMADKQTVIDGFQLHAYEYFSNDQQPRKESLLGMAVFQQMGAKLLMMDNAQTGRKKPLLRQAYLSTLIAYDKFGLEGAFVCGICSQSDIIF